MMRKKKAVRKPRPKPLPKLTRSDDLCKRLCGIAAFHIEDPKAQMVVYAAIRQLQRLDAVAVEAGILPPPS